jgi:hypothetical protein
MRMTVESSRIVAVVVRTSCPVRGRPRRKFPLSQNRDDGFFAFSGEHGKLDVAPQNIKDSIRRIPLRKENLLLPAPQNFFRQ